MWDPALEATANWFVWKMMTLNPREQTVLVHLVLEESSSVFSAGGEPDIRRLRGKPITSPYTTKVNIGHKQMGTELSISSR